MPREESNSAPSPHHSRRRRAAETGGSASAASHPIAFDQKLTTSNRKSFNLIFYRFRSIFLRTRNHKILIFSLSLLSYQWGWISSLLYVNKVLICVFNCVQEENKHKQHDANWYELCIYYVKEYNSFITWYLNWKLIFKKQPSR